MPRFLAFFIFTIATVGAQSAWALQIFRTGNPTDVISKTYQAVCLAGGGDDDYWAGGWRYLLDQSNQGDVVIIRADKNRGGYEPWIYNDEGRHQFPKVNSVTTLLFESAADANRPEAITAILNAELIFFAGGDQTLYIDWFKNSKLNQALNYLIYVKKIPVGGTSAGMALLAGIDFAAHDPSPADQKSNVSSGDVMKDPTGRFVDLDRSVVTAPYLTNVITDTHFSQRSREGRVVGFMARAIYNQYDGVNLQNIKAIAADEKTAFCYNNQGQGKVYGPGDVFFLKANSAIDRIEPGHSLDWYGQGKAIRTYVISGQSHSARFDLQNWSGLGGHDEFWSVDGRDEANPIFVRH